MMLRYLCSLTMAGSLSLQAQWMAEVLAPPGLVGELESTAANWAQTPDLIFPWNSVTDTAVFVHDGTAADSLGCLPLINAAEVNGRIAVFYRGSCEYGQKALYAQNAGAVGVVVINNVPDPPSAMGAGAVGDSITIPVVLITDVDGAALRDAIYAGEVVIKLGNPCDQVTECDDIRVHLEGGWFVPGFQSGYYITVQNLSPFIDRTNVNIDLEYDPVLTFVSATGSIVLNEPGHLMWELASLPAGATAFFTVDLMAPPDTALIGTELTAFAQITAVPTDADLTNNSYVRTRIVASSFDPNDKHGTTSSEESSTAYVLGIDEWIEYTIRFQNTGTAPATFVYLIDTLSAVFLPAVPDIVGASHPFTADLIGDHVLRFDFANINLPDSTTNEPASHGFVSFRLKPAPGLVPGTLLANAADIYFDFNPPVRTNTSEITATIWEGVEENSRSNVQFFPNPASGMVVIRPSASTSIERMILRSATGAELMRTTWPQGITSFTFDASRLSPGVYVFELIGAEHRVVRFVKE